MRPLRGCAKEARTAGGNFSCVFVFFSSRVLGPRASGLSCVFRRPPPRASFALAAMLAAVSGPGVSSSRHRILRYITTPAGLHARACHPRPPPLFRRWRRCGRFLRPHFKKSGSAPCRPSGPCPLLRLARCGKRLFFWRRETHCNFTAPHCARKAKPLRGAGAALRCSFVAVCKMRFPRSTKKKWGEGRKTKAKDLLGAVGPEPLQAASLGRSMGKSEAGRQKF